MANGLGGFPGGTSGRRPAYQCRRYKSWVPSLGWKDTLEEGMVTHSNILAWRIPWREEPGRLWSIMVLQSQTQLKQLSPYTNDLREVIFLLKRWKRNAEEVLKKLLFPHNLGNLYERVFFFVPEYFLCSWILLNKQSDSMICQRNFGQWWFFSNLHTGRIFCSLVQTTHTFLPPSRIHRSCLFHADLTLFYELITSKIIGQLLPTGHSSTISRNLCPYL